MPKGSSTTSASRTRKPKLGQHFLVRGSILDRIAAAACPQRAPLVIEIGPGKGALTERLLARADRVVAVEIDENWIEAMQYLNMDPLQEQKKEALRKLGDAA